MDYSVCFLVAPMTTNPGTAMPTVSWLPHINHQSRESVLGQNNFSVEVSSSHSSSFQADIQLAIKTLLLNNKMHPLCIWDTITDWNLALSSKRHKNL